MMVWESSEHRLSCDLTGVTHRVSIDRPFRNGLQAPPLIVCLDGAWVAGTVRDATRIMSMSGEAPEAVVVGVWFEDDSMAAYLRSRARWFTPTSWVPPPEVGVKDVEAADAGHAATYQRFVSERLLPFLRDQVDPGEMWLVGHSFSALFGLRVLFTDAGLFDTYLLASPSIWWHDRAILELADGFCKSHRAVAARVFLSAGDDEGANQFDDDTFRMRANVVELADRLGQLGSRGLAVHSQILPDETHNSTIGAAVGAGLRFLTSSMGLPT